MRRSIVLCLFACACSSGAPPARYYEPPYVHGPRGTGGTNIYTVPLDLEGARTCGAGEACRDACPGGRCSYVCRRGSSCDLGCAGGRCQTLCEAGARCDVQCTGGRCAQACTAGATCDLTCAGGGCQQTCEPGATCAVDCAPGTCTTNVVDAS